MGRKMHKDAELMQKERFWEALCDIMPLDIKFTAKDVARRFIDNRGVFPTGFKSFTACATRCGQLLSTLCFETEDLKCLGRTRGGYLYMLPSTSMGRRDKPDEPEDLIGEDIWGGGM